MASPYIVVNENTTHITIKITYTHSEHDISIESSNAIPEFPLTPVAILIILAAIILVLMKKKLI